MAVIFLSKKVKKLIDNITDYKPFEMAGRVVYESFD